jgi:hypothetical protein
VNRRRLEVLERELGPEKPRVRFILHVPPSGLSAAEHAAYVAQRAFTLNLGSCDVEDGPS